MAVIEPLAVTTDPPEHALRVVHIARCAQCNGEPDGTEQSLLRGEPPGPIDMAGFTRLLYGQALRVLVEIEAGHETMAIDDQCKLLNTLGVLGKNLVALVKGSVDDSHAGSAIRKYAEAFKQPARRASARTAEDDELDLGDEDERA